MEIKLNSGALHIAYMAVLQWSYLVNFLKAPPFYTLFSAREKDPFDFKPDASSLQSILNNTGINDNLMRLQNTGRVTLAGGRLTPYLRSRQAFREVCLKIR